MALSPASLLTFWHIEQDAVQPYMLADATDFASIALVFIFILGGCFGSFANAAAMRLVRDESPIAPPSRCRFCEKPLGWRENMPLFGWLFLAGRCACKKFPLPKRYVAVEWGFACLTTWLAYSLPLPVFGLLCLLNIIILIALLTDSEAMVLYPPSLLAGIIIAFGASFFVPNWPVSPIDCFLGTLIGGSLIFGTNLIYRLTRGTNGFGQGDIWLLAMIGASFGSIGAIITFFGASMVGAITGITLILAKKAEISSKLPFGLFLSLVFLLYPALNMLLI